ncbi:MAG: hypothetical protein GWM98_19015, partial [Nitrospinaceae bacterium]|nr:hypothetical protein [Nitrospinaceae bacterium]
MTYQKSHETNMYVAHNAAGAQLITPDVWEAVKHCDPELRHNAMQNMETGKPISPMEFKTASAGTVLSIGINTRKRYARKADREVLG